MTREQLATLAEELEVLGADANVAGWQVEIGIAIRELLSDMAIARGDMRAARENARAAWFALEREPDRARALLDQVDAGLGRWKE